MTLVPVEPVITRSPVSWKKTGKRRGWLTPPGQALEAPAGDRGAVGHCARGIGGSVAAIGTRTQDENIFDSGGFNGRGDGEFLVPRRPSQQGHRTW